MCLQRLWSICLLAGAVVVLEQMQVPPVLAAVLAV
jgi:hypothetical protein